jgi:DHA1 family tetracycline resistance protein-like MFS transporter
MKRPLAFLLVTVFLDMLGLGLIVPIAPALLVAITGSAVTGARWSGLIDTSYGLLQFLTASWWGRLADRYGRRPVLIASITLLGLDFLTHAVAAAAWQLVAAHALAGLFAGGGAAVNAYIADVTSPDQRARAYGLVGAAFSVGFIAGPALGGLLGGVNIRLPFLVAGCLGLLNAAVGLLVLPESRRGDRQTSLSFRIANPFSAVAALIRHRVLGALAIAQLCRDVARMIDQVCWVFFMMTRFGWSTAHIGIALGGYAVGSGVLDGKIAGPAINHFGARRVVLWCGALSALSFAALAVIPSDGYAYPVLVADMIAGLAGPAISTLIANATSPDEQGTVQGALGCIGAIAETLVPVAALTLFAATVPSGWPGAIFAVAAGAAAVGVLAVRRARPTLDRHELPAVADTAI